MKKALWITYGIIAVGINVLVGLAILVSESHPLLLLALLPSTLICVSALYGYLSEKPLINRKMWRFLLWWIVLGTFVNLVKAILSNSVAEALDPLVSVLLGIPLIYLIHNYSNAASEIWGNNEIAKHAQELNSLLSAHETLTAQAVSETPAGKTEMSVHITKVNEIFIIKLSKNILGDQQGFRNEFKDPCDLIEFLNDNSIFKAPDLKPA